MLDPGPYGELYYQANPVQTSNVSSAESNVNEAQEITLLLLD